MPLTEKMVRLAAPGDEIPVGDEQGPDTAPESTGEQSTEEQAEEALGSIEAGLELLKGEASDLFEKFEAAPRGSEDLESMLSTLEDLKDTAEKCTQAIMEYQGNFTESPVEEGPATASLKKKAEEGEGVDEEEKMGILGSIEMSLNELKDDSQMALNQFNKWGFKENPTAGDKGKVESLMKTLTEIKESADWGLEALDKYMGLVIPKVGPGEPGHGPSEKMGPPSSASKKD